jgi:hypothetical protein
MALALVLVTSADVRADLIHWSYNWSRSPAEVHADSPGTGKLVLTDEHLQNAVGSSDIVATNLHAYSTATPSNPDHFTNKPYTLSLFLLDQASGRSGTLTFTGVFNGTLTATSANLTTTLTGLTTQTLLLGNHLYTARIGPYSPPGPPGAINSGSISAHADVTVQTVFHVPEPGTFSLACLALPCLGLLFQKRFTDGGDAVTR